MTIFTETAYKLRGLLASIVPVVALFYPYTGGYSRPVYWSLGCGLVLLGFLVRLWSQQHNYYRLDVDMQLARSGPYALMRNPMYVGNTLICMGLTALGGILWLVPVALVWCGVVYSLVVRFEESHLEEQYGEDYREYRRDIGRWCPTFPSSWKAELVTTYFGRAIRAELHNLFLVVPYLVREWYLQADGFGDIVGMI